MLSEFKVLHLWSIDSHQEWRGHLMWKEQSFQQIVLRPLAIHTQNNEVDLRKDGRPACKT